jgi:hypothetical protein
MSTDATKEQRIRETAQKAADYLRKHGWQPRERPSSAFKGPCCILNALGSVADAEGAFLEVRDRIARLIGTPMVGHWNDTKCANADEAIGLLTRIANGGGAS